MMREEKKFMRKKIGVVTIFLFMIIVLLPLVACSNHDKKTENTEIKDTILIERLCQHKRCRVSL